MTPQAIQQTLVLIKPDALKLSLTGYVLSQLSEFHTGLRFAGAKIVHVSRMLAEEHYAEHKERFFYPSLINYLMGRIHYADAPQKRRVIALVYSGPGAVNKVRELAGPTNPHDAREKAPGTIRALGTVVPVLDPDGNVLGNRLDNLIHAAANESDAEREIKLWFKPEDIMPYMRAYPTAPCDEFYYLHDGRVSTAAAPGATCVLDPGHEVWESDLLALRQIAADQPAACSLDAVMAKYFINKRCEPD
jgi:nucleoside-diphosphate kinase